MREFKCYSARLNRALQKNGFAPLFAEVKDDSVVYVYEYTKELEYYRLNKYQSERDKF